MTRASSFSRAIASRMFRLRRSISAELTMHAPGLVLNECSSLSFVNEDGKVLFRNSANVRRRERIHLRDVHESLDRHLLTFGVARAARRAVIERLDAETRHH